MVRVWRKHSEEKKPEYELGLLDKENYYDDNYDNSLQNSWQKDILIWVLGGVEGRKVLIQRLNWTFVFYRHNQTKATAHALL